MKKYYFAMITITDYWKLRLIERGTRENLPSYSVLTETRFKYQYKIAEGIWLSKVARALYA